MKTFSEYIADSIIDEDLLSVNEDLIMEGTFLSKLADWIGIKAKNIKDKWQEYKKDWKNFNNNVKLAYNGYIANIQTDKKITKEDSQTLLEKILSTDINKIPSVVAGIYKSDSYKYKASPQIAYLYKFGLEVAKANNDSENIKILQQAFDSIPSEVKKEAKDNLKSEIKRSKEEENNNKIEEEPVTVKDDDNKEINKKEGEEKIEDEIIKDPLLSLSKEAGFDNIQLKGVISTLIWNNNKDKSTEDFNKMVTGIGAVVCGAKILGDDKKLNDDILKGWGIDSIKVLLDEVIREIK